MEYQSWRAAFASAINLRRDSCLRPISSVYGGRKLVANGTQFKDYFWYLVIVIVASSFGLLFDHLGRPELERPAAFALGMMLLAVEVCRDVRGRPWFWLTIVAIAALHVPLL